MSLSKPSSIESIQKQIRDHNIRYIRFEQADLHGVSRSKTVPVNSFMDYVENGLNFYGGLLGLDIQSRVPTGTGYAEEVAFEDHCTIPDLSTFTVLPWAPNTANITVDPYWYDGRPAMASPRLLLKKIINEFDAMGYICRLGYEFEFYVLDKDTRKPVYTGQPIFVTLKNNFDIDYVYDLMDKMDQAGVRVITQNSEHGPGQQEINLYYQDGLPAADTAFLYKMGAKEISLQHGYIATWLTKPFIDSSASGSHFHVSLIDKKTGKNAFNDLGQAARQRVFFRQFGSILRFRWMQFHGTYVGYRRSGPLTWQLKQSFYYPRENGDKNKENAKRDVKPITYD